MKTILGVISMVLVVGFGLMDVEDDNKLQKSHDEYALALEKMMSNNDGLAQTIKIVRIDDDKVIGKSGDRELEMSKADFDKEGIAEGVLITAIVKVGQVEDYFVN